MLQTMRQLAQSWVFKGLMMLLIVSFGIWGIGDIFRGNPQQRAVATVGDETITVQDVKKEFDIALVQMRRSFGPELTEQQAKQFGLLDKVLENMIADRQLELDAKRLGIDVTEKAALEWFATLEEFRNKDGSFNRELFASTAERERMSQSEFLKKWQDKIASRELFGPFGLVGKTPHTIVEAVARARAQKRILDVITLANDSVRDIPTPDDKTLHDFYDQNPKAFTAPESRSITIAHLATADVIKGIAISDEDLKKEYEARLDQYTHPERRDILQAVAQDEGQAKQIAAAARAGGNLTSAASEAGLKTVPINGTEEKTLLPELGKPVFALTLGQVSDPIKSPLGWHILQLKKITPPGTSSFDEVKEDLRASMQRDQGVDAATRVVNQLDDELAAGHPLEDIAGSLKLQLTKIPELEATGKTPDGKVPPDLPKKEDDILKAAFTQNAGDVSPIIDDKVGNYFVVRTDQVMPSSVRPFDKVKDKVLAAWKAQEQNTRAASGAEEIAKGLREGKAPSSFAADSGVDIRVSKPVSLLGDNDPQLPAAALPQIAKMKKGEVITVPAPGHQVILRLAQLANPDGTSIKLAEVKVGNDTDAQFQEELVSEYRQHLRDLFPSKVNAEVLESLRQQGI